MKVTFNAKKDTFYNIFVRGVVEPNENKVSVWVKDDKGNPLGYQVFQDPPGLLSVQMNLMVRSGWEGLTTLWLSVEGASWYFSQTEQPSIMVRKV